MRIIDIIGSIDIIDHIASVSHGIVTVLGGFRGSRLCMH